MLFPRFCIPLYGRLADSVLVDGIVANQICIQVLENGEVQTPLEPHGVKVDLMTRIFFLPQTCRPYYTTKLPLVITPFLALDHCSHLAALEGLHRAESRAIETINT